MGGGYIVENKNVNYENFLAIVDLNFERCRGKGFESGVQPEQLYKELDGFCVLNYFVLDGTIAAGTISSVYNGAMNLHVIAHSNDYGRFNIGNLILLKTIEYAIVHEIKIFNFLWGGQEYKKRFGATEQLFYDACFYKNNSLYVIEKGFYYVQRAFLWFAKEIKKIILFLVKGMKWFLKKLGLFDIVKHAYHKAIGK